MSTYETLGISEHSEFVCVVTLSRPQAANSLNTQMSKDLVHFFEATALAPGALRCIVLTGMGTSAFCAGGDLKERLDMTDSTWMRQHAVFERMARALLACPIPILAAVNGAAYGGGCEIAAACDFIYAAETARFALPEVTLGIMPGAGGTQNLPRAIGQRRAKELILTGKPFSAQQALDWGLVNQIYPSIELLPAAIEAASVIAANAPTSIRQAKQAIDRGIQMSIWDGLAFEIQAYNRTTSTEDRHEGVRAFNEKRKPVFKGI
ncbi:unannotated protein [freshwater metagenome]|uniref:Unannotated protein n=1 Tax=freshwater metagenome TaxID=449393 RepID=A0A6J6ZQX2_9ZZZZ|nr:enoyl-CoA hydratase [Actinomycetota bacterium]